MLGWRLGLLNQSKDTLVAIHCAVGVALGSVQVPSIPREEPDRLVHMVSLPLLSHL